VKVAVKNWADELVKLVGKCVEDQRDGYDALASASWDDVLAHWKQRPRTTRS